MNDDSNKIISFAEFELDTVHRRLSRDGETVALHAKAFDLLTFLAQNNGRIVSKDEILDTIWEGSFVEEANLVVQISNLRKALGETKNAPQFLITVPGKGYKFAAETKETSFIIETHSISELTIEQTIEETQDTKPSLTKTVRMKWKWLGFAGITILAIAGIVWMWSRNSNATVSKLPRLTKLSTSGRIFNATMLPDGNFAVFSQKEENGESLWLRQLETGSEKKIVEPQPIEYVGLTVSPDNQFIYASIFSQNDIDPFIHKIPLLGGVLQKIPNITCGSAISISPDGKHFAYTDSNSAEKETLLGVADIDGSNSRFLIRANHDKRYFSMFKSSPVAWSPNGFEIAVAVLEKSDSGSFATILMVNPNDRSERYLTEKRWKHVDNLAWLDSDKLAFIAQADDGLPNQVWLISSTTGEAKQLTNELQDYNWLAAADGKILTVQTNAFSSLRIADFEESEKILKVREVFSASDYIDELDWSKNGEIIYASKASGKSELWLMKVDGSNRHQLTSDANVTFGITVSPLDGNLIFASKQNGKRGIWQTDADGKNLRPVSEGGDQSPDVSNDGKIVFHRGLGYAEGVFLTSQNGASPKMLKERCYFPSISPDGSKTVCYFMDAVDDRKWRIALISNETGEIIGKLTLPIPIYERQIRWHPSGKYITQIFAEGENLKLILLPIEDGEAKVFEGLGKGSSNLPEWSPDGKKFIYPLITESHDAVLLTEFYSTKNLLF